MIRFTNQWKGTHKNLGLGIDIMCMNVEFSHGNYGIEITILGFGIFIFNKERVLHLKGETEGMNDT